MATDNMVTLENLNIPKEIQRFESEVPVETSPPHVTKSKTITKHLRNLQTPSFSQGNNTF